MGGGIAVPFIAANMYGAVTGDSQWFYSLMQPPSADYNIAPGGANTGTHGIYPTNQDCSLVVEQGTTSGGTTTYPSPAAGNLFYRVGIGREYEHKPGPLEYHRFLLWLRQRPDNGDRNGYCPLRPAVRK